MWRSRDGTARIAPDQQLGGTRLCKKRSRTKTVGSTNLDDGFHLLAIATQELVGAPWYLNLCLYLHYMVTRISPRPARHGVELISG